MNTNSKNSVATSSPSFPFAPVVIGAFIFIIAAGAALLALNGCSTAPEAVAREDALILTLSNAVEHVQQYSALVPPPANSFVEPLLGLCGAALAIWSGYLHRNVRVLVRAANGNASPPGPAPSPPTAADLAARAIEPPATAATSRGR